MTCPTCGGPLSLPYPSRHRVGMVVQTCKNQPACGRSVWSAASDVIVPPVVDDGRRHGRMFLVDAPLVLVAPNRWARFTDAELSELNAADRKIAAAGGDR